MRDLYEVVARVLNIPADSITPGLGRENSSEWDSFNHLMLVSEIEKAFGIQIPMNKIETIKTVADLEKIVKPS